jgi:dipeptidyl aminopeptidase/acylaminoacyl peptidase
VQLGSPALSPDRASVAFVEGLSSDRGLTAGALRVIDLEQRTLSTPGELEDVTWVDWLTDRQLIYAGWRGVGTVVGRLDRSTGVADDVWHEPATLGLDYRPQLALGDGLAAGIVERAGEPAELCVLEPPAPGSRWRARTALNEGRSVAGELEIEEVSWTGVDGLEIGGLLWRPAQEPAEALVVLAHGGPSLAWTHAYSPSRGLAAPLVAAGFTVLLPNPRGSVGRGSEFARANLDDLGGLDFEDLVAGVEWCRRTTFAGEPVPVGIAGASYGGYLASVAAATGRSFKAAVAIATISDWTSQLYASASGEFTSVYLRHSTDAELRDRCVELSPIHRVGPDSIPTLILHGELDQCTPVGQGVELYNALRRAGGDTELVIYPNEGHGISARDNQLDLIRRTIAWFSKHLLDGS